MRSIGNLRSIDFPWGEDQVVYFDCDSDDFGIERWDCYNNGHKFILFHSEKKPLSQIKFAKNGLVIAQKTIQGPGKKYYDYANLWYNNGLLHNSNGPAIVYNTNWGNGWFFSWYMNGKPWKCGKHGHRFNCKQENVLYEKIYQDRRRIYIKDLVNNFHGKIPIN